MVNEKKLLDQTYGLRCYHAGLAIRKRGRGPRLVLVHGGVGSRTHWSKNIDALSENFTVVTLDLPGFGESARVPEGMSIPEYRAWVSMAVCHAADHQPFHLVAFSFGAAVSAGILSLLAQQGCAPERLSLVSPSGFGTPTGRTVKLEKVKKTEDASMADIKAATARNLGRWMLAIEPDADDPVIDAHLRNARLAAFDSRDISYENSLISNLQGLEIPVQIMLGDKDALIFPSVQERVALLNESLPNIRVEVVSGAGHWLQYEAACAVNNRINQFHL